MAFPVQHMHVGLRSSFFVEVLMPGAITPAAEMG